MSSSRDTSSAANARKLEAARRRQGRSGGGGGGGTSSSPPAIETDPPPRPITMTGGASRTSSSGVATSSSSLAAAANRAGERSTTALHTPGNLMDLSSASLSSISRRNHPSSGAGDSLTASAAHLATSTPWSTTTSRVAASAVTSAAPSTSVTSSFSASRHEVGVATRKPYAPPLSGTPARSTTAAVNTPSRAASEAAAAAVAALESTSSYRTASRTGPGAAAFSSGLASESTRTPLKSNLHGATSLGGDRIAHDPSFAAPTTTTKAYSSLLASTLTTHRVSQQQQQRQAAGISPTRSTNASASSSIRSHLLLHPDDTGDSGPDPGQTAIVTVEDHERWLRESVSAASSWDSLPTDASCLVSGCRIQIFTHPAASKATGNTATAKDCSSSEVGSASVLRYVPVPTRSPELNDDASTADGSRIGEPGTVDTSPFHVDAKGVLSLPTAPCFEAGDGGFDLIAGNNNTMWEVQKCSRPFHQPYRSADIDLLCYGDIVTLRAWEVNSKLEGDDDLVLSVEQEHDSKDKLRLSNSVDGSQDQQWEVIRWIDGPDGLVLVGESAMRSSAERSDDRGRIQSVMRRSFALSSASPLVRSGEPLLLRSCLNGGILANGADGSLTLLTDSYDSSLDRSFPQGQNESSLLDRLQRHHVLSPSNRELFHFVLAYVPGPLLKPRCTDSEVCSRSYQTGAHLMHANRFSAGEVHKEDKGSSSTVEGIGTELHLQREKVMLESQSQEPLLLDEVLGSFLGLEGTFVRAESYQQYVYGLPRFTFRVTNGSSNLLEVDLSLRNAIENELLPLSSSYANVRGFVGYHLNKYENGAVFQALCAQLEVILVEYAEFISALEARYRESSSAFDPALMKRLLADVRPAAHTMRLLESVVEAVRGEKGGALVNALDRTRYQFEGDAVASKLMISLLDACTIPFMRMLNQWIISGVLNDPFEEFMICFDPKAKTWENQYTVVEEHVLSRFFPSKDSALKLTATGRFWNAIRLCRNAPGDNDTETDSESVATEFLEYKSSVAEMATQIHVMHKKASLALLNLLFRNYDLLSSLRLTKRYFLLDQGDFFVRFMDACENELLKEAAEVSLGRVQHWLSTAITLTDYDDSASLAVGSTPRALTPSNLVTRFTTKGLLSHLDKLLASPSGIVSPRKRVDTSRRSDSSVSSPEVTTGLDVFLIEYQTIPFPLSLILTKQAMASYQLLFRHLFYVKYVERRLVGIWLDHQTLRELQALRGALGGTYLLRQRMLHFVQNLIYYVMLEVIEPNWLEFENNLRSSDSDEPQSADDICTSHTLFLRKTLEACLMTNRDVLGALTKLLGTCLMFTNEMKTFMLATKLDEDRRSVAKEKRSQFQRALNERQAPGRPTLSRSTATKILVDDMTERKNRVRKQTARVARELSSESYRMMISRFDEVFTDHLREFMLQLKYADGLFHSHKVNLCTRLDYNGFVSKALGLSDALP